LTLHDKHNIRTLSDNVNFICSCCQTGRENVTKDSLFCSIF